MNDLKKIIEKIESLENRIGALEKLFSKPKMTQGVKIKKSLTDFVIELRGEGFFKQPKTAIEVREKLLGVYHCKVDRVSMCLLRVAEKKQLRKANKKISGKNYLAYTW